MTAEGGSAAGTNDQPRIFAATPGPHGIVYRGAELSRTEAETHRRAGLDLVVCGPDTRANRRLAKELEDSVGPNIHHEPSLGPDSLPHYQPHPRPPEGHCFYERRNARAKRLRPR